MAAAHHVTQGVRVAHDTFRVVRDTVHDLVRDTVVRVAQPALADSLHLKLISGPWTIFKDILTVLLPVASFWLGTFVTKRIQDRREAAEKARRQVTAARLTRRYLIYGERLLKGMAAAITEFNEKGPEKGGFFSLAYVEHALRTLSDFDEIKTRMIELENDSLEEAIWQWNADTIDHLQTFRDVFNLSDEDLKAKHGDWHHREIMFATQHAMVLSQGHKAEELAKRVEAYIPKENTGPSESPIAPQTATGGGANPAEQLSVKESEVGE